MKKLPLALGALTLAMFFSCTKDIQQDTTNDAAGSAANSNAVNENAGDPFVSDEILVKFKANTSDENKDKAFKRIGGTVSEKILTKAMKHAGDDEGIYLVKASVKTLEAISKIQGVEIEFAEPNYIYTHDASSSDTYYTNGSLWGMYGDASSPANQYGSQAAEAWAVGHTGSSNVYVGIIDEGIQFEHPDLNANIWTNPYDPVGGGDNDGNGYTDDTHGWDFAGNNNSIYDGGRKGNQDDHGTHVSGTIGAESNGTGVVGVNWNVTLISGKFLGVFGGNTANAIKAVDYFTDLKNRHGLNIVATNNSWGGGGFSQGLYDAISRANNAGILFIAAAGNSGTDNDVTASYPANYDLANVISVAAISSTGGLASFSQYGATTVDLGAPGVGVWSTTASNTYSSYNGTSMATPHVTGAVALYKSVNTNATAAQIKNSDKILSF